MLEDEFLDSMRPFFSNSSSLASVVRKWKSEAIRISWQDAINESFESNGHDGSLFIKDALFKICVSLVLFIIFH